MIGEFEAEMRRRLLDLFEDVDVVVSEMRSAQSGISDAAGGIAFESQAGQAHASRAVESLDAAARQASSYNDYLDW